MVPERGRGSPFRAGGCVSPPGRCRANMAHMRQSRPYPGLSFQVKYFSYSLFPRQRSHEESSLWRFSRRNGSSSFDPVRRQVSHIPLHSPVYGGGRGGQRARNRLSLSPLSLASLSLSSLPLPLSPLSTPTPNTRGPTATVCCIAFAGVRPPPSLSLSSLSLHARLFIVVPVPLESGLSHQLQV